MAVNEIAQRGAERGLFCLYRYTKARDWLKRNHLNWLFRLIGGIDKKYVNNWKSFHKIPDILVMGCHKIFFWPPFGPPSKQVKNMLWLWLRFCKDIHLQSMKNIDSAVCKIPNNSEEDVTILGLVSLFFKALNSYIGNVHP